MASGRGQADAVPGAPVPREAVATGLENLLAALAALHRDPAGAAPALACATRACAVVVGDAHHRGRQEPGLEFEAVLAGRLARRYLRVVADAAAGRPVPLTWALLLDPPASTPALLALAGVGTLLDHDLTLAFASTCTVLGRAPGGDEREAHGHVATLLAAAGATAARPAAAALADPVRRAAAHRRAEGLWALRGCPAEAEAQRRALDLEVRAATLRLLTGSG